MQITIVAENPAGRFRFEKIGVHNVELSFVQTLQAAGSSKSWVLHIPQEFNLPEISDTLAEQGLPSVVESTVESTVESMVESMEKDPMLGFCCLGPRELELPTLTPLPRSCFLLMRSELIAEFLPKGEMPVAETLARLSVLANRVGYITKAFPSQCWNPESDPLNNSALCQKISEEYPGLESALRSYNQTRSFFEPALLSERPKILLDFLGLHPIINGSLEVALQILRSLLEADKLEISVNISADTAALTDLSRFSSRLKIFHSVSPESRVDVAFLASQPTLHSHFANLAISAPRIAFLAHDLIGFDCMQLREQQPLAVSLWNLVAEHADLILFGSDFSRRIFTERFEVPDSTRLEVCHWSLSPEDYLHPPPCGAIGVEHPALEKNDAAPYCAILGNQFYAHKGIEQILPMIIEKFPMQKFRCLGLSESPAPNILAFESGALTWRSVSRLIEQAEFVIIPTFYEGFGLPLFHALSRNKIVLARESELIHELQKEWTGPNSLILYRDTDDLSERLTDLFDGRVPKESLFSRFIRSGVEKEARTWRQIGNEISDLLLTLAAQPPLKCRARLKQLNFPGQFEQIQLIDQNLRLCITQRDALQAEVGNYDENLRIAIRGREALQRQLLELQTQLQPVLKDGKSGERPGMWPFRSRTPKDV